MTVATCRLFYNSTPRINMNKSVSRNKNSEGNSRTCCCVFTHISTTESVQGQMQGNVLLLSLHQPPQKSQPLGEKRTNSAVVEQTKRVAMQCVHHPNKYVCVHVVLAYGVNRLPLPPLVSFPPRPPPPPPLAADDTPYCGYEP